jgi:hypothetical protein
VSSINELDSPAQVGVVGDDVADANVDASPPSDASQDHDDSASLSRQEAREQEREKFRISNFDVVTSFFMSLILFIGVFVGMLFIIWLTSQFSFKAVPIKPIIENPAGRGENPEGFEEDFEPPGADEVEELLEPTLQDTIEAVTDAVSSVAASLTTNDTSATATSSGSGAGDKRPPGPLGDGDDIVPRSERWQLNFTAKNQSSYVKQLAFWNIELGAVGGNVQGLDVVNNLAGRPKSRRIQDASTEKRLYFMFKRPSPLMQYERSVHNEAGVNLSGRNMFKLIPPELENLLANIELEYSKSKGHPSVTEIAKTVFESKANGSGYEFEVITQRYRK